MPAQKILVCGAGISGSVVAYFLARQNFQVTVIERSRASQKAGQGLEIEEPALTVVKEMDGVLDELKKVRTGEQGFELVDEKGRSWARLDADKGFSPTGALEMMRGDMTEVFYRAADEFENVRYEFQTTIEGLKQNSKKAVVELKNRTDNSIRTEEFDLVIGADGVKSRTRQLLMGSDEELNCLKPVGAYVSYFSIPKADSDWPRSQLCHFPKRRIMWLRPMSATADLTSVYLIHCARHVPALHAANLSGDRSQQKKAFANLYSGLGWQADRVIAGMMKTDNFYSDELAQIKLPTWSKDRVVLLGDSAWAPTPFTGQGNQLAIIGAWVLAQELSRNPSPLGLQKYEQRLRPYVESCQTIALGGYMPYLLNPQTNWGIWTVRSLFWLLAGVTKVFLWTGAGNWLPERSANLQPDFDLQIGPGENGTK